MLFTKIISYINHLYICYKKGQHDDVLKRDKANLKAIDNTTLSSNTSTVEALNSSVTADRDRYKTNKSFF